MGEAAIHKTAVIDPGAKVGAGTKAWAFVQVGANAVIGENCVLGNGCYIDRNAKVGNNVKVMNKAQVFRGCEIGNDVFIGPGAVIANDRKPKVDEERKFSGYEWKIGNSVSIGANATILPDVDIGEYALIGAGAVVTKDVPRHGLVYGNPARLKGFVCKCGARVTLLSKDGEKAIMQCPECKKGLQVPIDLFNQIRE